MRRGRRGQTSRLFEGGGGPVEDHWDGALGFWRCSANVVDDEAETLEAGVFVAVFTEATIDSYGSVPGRELDSLFLIIGVFVDQFSQDLALPTEESNSLGLVRGCLMLKGSHFDNLDLLIRHGTANGELLPFVLIIGVVHVGPCRLKDGGAAAIAKLDLDPFEVKSIRDDLDLRDLECRCEADRLKLARPWPLELQSIWALSHPKEAELLEIPVAPLQVRRGSRKRLNAYVHPCSQREELAEKLS